MPTTRLPPDIRFHKVMLGAGLIGFWHLRVRDRLVFADPRVVEAFELPAKVVRIGASPEQFAQAIHHDDIPYTLAAIETAITLRVDFRARFRLRGPDGEWRMVSSKAKPSVVDGKLAHFDGLCMIAEQGGDTDPVNRMALLASELFQLGRKSGDRETAHFAEIMLLHLGGELASRLSAH